MLRAALLASVFLLADPVQAAQPNIIVIMTDDQEDNLANMPRVNARLNDGARFVNSFVNFPLCSPSRATFFSGQLAHNHAVDENNPPPGSFINKGLLPMWLQDVGYTTALIGVKTLNQFFEPPTALGFDHYAIAADRNAARYYDIDLDVNGVVTPRPGEYSTDIFGAEAARFIRDTVKPYFLVVAAAAPHAPAIPADRHRGLCNGVPLPRPASFNELDVTDKPSFVAELPEFDPKKESKLEKAFREKCETLLSVDEMAASLIDRAGTQTCVFYTSDHGFLQGQHRITGKLYPYEESIRTPLVMWGCGAPRGAQIDALVYNADWTATIVELAGAVPSRKQDGKSLLPLLDGTPTWRTALPIHADGGGVSGDCVRTVLWMYCAHATGERELYSIDRDPYQLTNKASAPDRQDIAASLHKLAIQLKSCAGDECWFAADPMAVKRPRR